MKPLHNDTFQKMATDGHLHAAFLTDVLYHHNINPGEILTVKMVMDITGLSEHTTRRALSDHVVFKPLAEKRDKPGRPTLWYKVPDRDKLRNHFLKKHEQVNFCDDLPQWAYTSIKDYRLARMQAFILRRQTTIYDGREADIKTSGKPFRISTGQLADLFGISKPTARRYKKILQVETQPDFDTMQVTGQNLHRVPDQPNGHAQYLAIGTFDEIKRGGGKKMPLMQAAAWWGLGALKDGQRLWWVRQMASFIWIPGNVAMYCGAGQYDDGMNIISPVFGVEAVAA